MTAPTRPGDDGGAPHQPGAPDTDAATRRTDTVTLDDGPDPSPVPSGRRDRRRRRRRRRRAASGATPVDRADRLILAVVGLVAAAAGAGVLALRDPTEVRAPGEIYADVAEMAEANPSWWAYGGAALAGVVALLALWWAWLQVRRARTDGRESTTVVPGTSRGRTEFEPVGLAHAVGRDLASVDGVERARARFVALGRRPALVAVLWLADGADVGALRREIEGPVARSAGVLGVDDLEVELHLRFRPPTGPRVR